ncbi:SDR family oxidoreductase [Curtobacterium sp. BRB10]|uniref:SDR family NAD(P)-dependent oxidoreductase n=1 Tax=Curtobacterium sp. BRB10 TaxID=2962579 RepID=UPI0028815D16|nr:SDR family oxidoreductase [Curtobacterium sp. BRB10]MDT0234840.1 SDR family oxidoreductase [Curtobacterium sp. BRB10]
MTTPHTDPTPAAASGRGLLEDKVAVITGAGAGIGAVTARRFVEEGARVLVSDMSGDEVQVTAALGAAAEPFHVDVTSESEIEAAFDHAVEVFGRVDVLVNIAGNPGSRRGPEVTEEEYHAITDVHLRGTLMTNKHAARVMIAGGRGGAIVNFSSAASFGVDGKVSVAYSAAKAGVNAATRSNAVQYGGHGIRVNAIAPGFTTSLMHHGISPEALAVLDAKSALGRSAESEEQANVAVFLASELASFVTGAILPVDGGWTVRLA